SITIQSTLVNIAQSQFRGPLALSRVMRSFALQNQGLHEAAIRGFDEALEALGNLVRAGKNHFKPTLALSQMLRALSLSATGKPGEALEACETAVAILQEHVQAGRRDLFGSHAHSMLIHALILYRHNSQDEGRIRWQQGITRTKELIEQGETDLRMIVVRYSVEMILSIDEDDGFAASLLDTALEVAELVFRSAHRLEGLEAETHHAIDRLRFESPPQLRKADWERIEALDTWLAKRPIEMGAK
ncbi:MAG: hypothetical protein KDM64_15110, partial [Verrucomicrobiae bacterium]|nr:hypothetical protein [Verrucomicrobiae bacterium]